MKEIFPCVPSGEWTILRINTSAGLFAYRYIQALDLLEFPDFGDSDFNREQRRAALNNSVIFYKPLTAIVIFLNVVALEDLIRDFQNRIASMSELESYFPNIAKLKSKHKVFDLQKPTKQLEKDHYPILNYDELNCFYKSVFQVEPIPISEFPKLYDLAIIRHTVAHNGSIVRLADIMRFQHYEIKENQILNPPSDFVKELCNYLYQIGTNYMQTIEKKILTEVTKSFNKSSFLSRPEIFLKLIELFDYFGFLPQPNLPFPKDEEHASLNRMIVKEELLKKSFKKIENEYY